MNALEQEADAYRKAWDAGKVIKLKRPICLLMPGLRDAVREAYRQHKEQQKTVSEKLKGDNGSFEYAA